MSGRSGGRPWKVTRKFSDGKFMKYETIPHKDKAKAKHVAEELRSKGQKVRVTPYKYGYDVWHKEK